MAAGIVLAQHYMSEALRIHAAGLDHPDQVLAAKLLDWLKTEWLKKNRRAMSRCLIFISSDLPPSAIRRPPHASSRYLKNTVTCGSTIVRKR